MYDEMEIKEPTLSGTVFPQSTLRPSNTLVKSLQRMESVKLPGGKSIATTKKNLGFDFTITTCLLAISTAFMWTMIALLLVDLDNSNLNLPPVDQRAMFAFIGVGVNIGLHVMTRPMAYLSNRISSGNELDNYIASVRDGILMISCNVECYRRGPKSNKSNEDRIVSQR